MNLTTSPSPALAAVAARFLASPSDKAERAVLMGLNACLRADGFDPLPDGFIEWGCVEHGVIHVLAFEGQQWIEVNPNTGVIQAL